MDQGVESLDPNPMSLPGFQFIDHVAISVPAGQLEAHASAYKRLGFREIHREEMGSSDQVREVLLQIGDSRTLIQLLEPLTPDSPVQKAMDRNGGRGGLAHVALRVRSARAAFAALKAQGFNIIDRAPRRGSRGTTVFFLHPKSQPDVTFGVLYEIVEDPHDVEGGVV